MKFAKFKYTDVKNKETVREAVILAEASDNVLAIDVTHLSNEDQAHFWGEMEMLNDDFKQKLEKLKESFDLKYSVRTFKAARMSDRVDEEVF